MTAGGNRVITSRKLEGMTMAANIPKAFTGIIVLRMLERKATVVVAEVTLIVRTARLHV